MGVKWGVVLRELSDELTVDVFFLSAGGESCQENEDAGGKRETEVGREEEKVVRETYFVGCAVELLLKDNYGPR